MKRIFTTCLIALITFASIAQDNNGRYYSAGEIQSKAQVQYGRFEFRMYSSDMSGTTSTFFLWKEGSTEANIQWNEIDVETFGKSANSWQSNPIWEYETNDYNPRRWEGIHNSIPIANTWVTFTVEWTPAYIAWYNNGIQVRRILKGQNAPQGNDPVGNIADAMRMCFNHWATYPGTWLGAFNAADLPSFQFVDWFTYQKWNGNGFDAVSIRNDFNSLAEVTTNYNVSTHTFGENQCTFRAANMGVVNGMLWLSITGYNNARPPAGNEIPAPGATNVAVTGVSLSATTLSLAKPATSQLTATVAPANATNKTVTWTTSNAAVATVNAGGLVSSVNAGTATITATTQDGGKIATCAVTVSTGGGGTGGFNLKIEAENYSVMNGVQTEATTDAGGGLNVGFLDAADWMAYNNITIPATGAYTISYRIASQAGGGSMRLESNAGTVILDPTFTIPSTGGWQNWQTVTRTVNLPAGTYDLGVKIITGGFNINWFTIASNAAPATVAVTGVSLSSTNLSVAASSTAQLIATVAPANATNKTVAFTTSNGAVATVSASGLVTGVGVGTATITATTQDGAKVATCAVTVTAPATTFSLKIEAENYSVMNGVTTQATTDAGGGLNITSLDANDWTAYNNITIPSAGAYTITYRVAATTTTGKLQLETNSGATILDPSFTIPQTGGLQTWQTVTRTVNLPAGTYNLGLKIVAGTFNLNWLTITRSTGARSAKSAPAFVTESKAVLYPNPVVKSFRLIKGGAGISVLKIVNLSGNVCLTKTIVEGSNLVDISNLKSGVYFAQYQGGTKRYVEKIIKVD